MDFGYHHSTYHHEGDDLFGSVAGRARFLEDAGFSFVGFMDHLWQLPQLGRRDEGILDCYTALSATAAITDDVRLGGLVTCVHYRHPALLARKVASLDAVSGGRAVLGIGAGWYEAEYSAYGFAFPPPAERIGQLEEAVRLNTALWTEPSPVTHEGEHYAVEDVYLEPKPVQEPHPPVLVGGGGEQLTLRVVAEHADWWNLPSTDPDAYGDKLDVLREHCGTVGRDYDDVRKTVVSTTLIRDTVEDARAAYDECLSFAEDRSAPPDEYPPTVGTPADVAATVGAFADLGVDLFMIEPPLNDPETVERVADEVAPEFV